MRLFFVLFLFSVFILPYAKAQDTLPGFTASLKSNGKVLISWRNNYPAINQISIQRSSDSLRNFTTLITVPDPRIPENGFVDSKANSTKMYYRIFILFPNSKYMFTKSRRAVAETAEQSIEALKPTVKEKSKSTVQSSQSMKKDIKKQVDSVKTAAVKAPDEEEYLILPKIDNSRIYYMMENSNLKRPSVNNPGKMKGPTIEVEKILVVKRRDSIIMLLAGNQVRRFSDSLVKQTKDTLLFVNSDTLQIKPYIEIYKEPKEVYKISPFVFTSKDGNVTISLADYNHKNYFVAFYETDNTLVLEVKDIKYPVLIIDKTNFGHSGWFRFELYEDGKLKEKNKLLIPRE
ncbi:MAG TPA: hypothetical protein VGZ90_05915 [Puia sp.]|jgi:hypothetical protein|nr:hypothetical protein [Puia sp.]